MATFNTPIITTQGLEFIKSAIAGNDRLVFSNIVFSAEDLSDSTDDDIAKLSDLTEKDMENVPTTMWDKLTGEVRIRAVGYNESDSQAFYIRTYGLYATNQAGKQLLVAVAIAQEPEFVPAYNGKQINQLTYTFNFNLSKTDNIKFSDDHDIGVTQADLANIKDAVMNTQSAVKSIDLNVPVKQANSYTDSAINSYATDNQSHMSAALSSAGSVAVTNATNALSSANSYSNSKAADVAKDANGYTDTAIKNLDIDNKLEHAGFDFVRQLTSDDDLNDIKDDGFYAIAESKPKNMPKNANMEEQYLLLVFTATFEDNENTIQQLFSLASNLHDSYLRNLYDDMSFNWERTINESNLDSFVFDSLNKYTSEFVQKNFKRDMSHIYQYRGTLENDVSLDDLIQLDDGYWSTGENTNVIPKNAQKWGVLSKIHFNNNVVITYNDVWGEGIYKRFHRDDGWIDWSSISVNPL